MMEGDENEINVDYIIEEFKYEYEMSGGRPVHSKRIFRSCNYDESRVGSWNLFNYSFDEDGNYTISELAIPENEADYSYNSEIKRTDFYNPSGIIIGSGNSSSSTHYDTLWENDTFVTESMNEYDFVPVVNKYYFDNQGRVSKRVWFIRAIPVAYNEFSYFDGQEFHTPDPTEAISDIENERLQNIYKDELKWFADNYIDEAVIVGDYNPDSFSEREALGIAEDESAVSLFENHDCIFFGKSGTWESIFKDQLFYITITLDNDETISAEFSYLTGNLAFNYEERECTLRNSNW